MKLWLVLISAYLVANLNRSGASISLGRCSLICEKQTQECGGMTSDSTPSCNCSSEVTSISSHFPRTCSDLSQNHGVDVSGVYTIYPFENSTSLLVHCDLTTAGGGWMLFQRRIDGSEDFYRNFTDYVRGFGKLSGEFWLGLNTLHELTKDGEYELRADMEDFDNETRYATYRNFTVGTGTSFVLTIAGYSGTAGDGLGRQQGSRFSAKDFDQDQIAANSCAKLYKGGWWYDRCHVANPNGLYLRGDHESYADGIDWRPFRGYYHSMKRMELKIRKKSV